MNGSRRHIIGLGRPAPETSPARLSSEPGLRRGTLSCFRASRTPRRRSRRRCESRGGRCRSRLRCGSWSRSWRGSRISVPSPLGFAGRGIDFALFSRHAAALAPLPYAEYDAERPVLDMPLLPARTTHLAPLFRRERTSVRAHPAVLVGSPPPLGSDRTPVRPSFVVSVHGRTAVVTVEIRPLAPALYPTRSRATRPSR
jgi:hypothetical protein